MSDPINNIPDEWITAEEALLHIMEVEKCSRERAEELLAEFMDEKPASWREAQVQ